MTCDVSFVTATFGVRHSDGRCDLPQRRFGRINGMRSAQFRLLSFRDTPRRLYTSSKGLAARGRDHEAGLDYVVL